MEKAVKVIVNPVQPRQVVNSWVEALVDEVRRLRDENTMLTDEVLRLRSLIFDD